MSSGSWTGRFRRSGALRSEMKLASIDFISRNMGERRNSVQTKHFGEQDVLSGIIQ